MNNNVTPQMAHQMPISNCAECCMHSICPDSSRIISENFVRITEFSKSILKSQSTGDAVKHEISLKHMCRVFSLCQLSTTDNLCDVSIVRTQPVAV